jgi:hypothetical protein
MSLRNAQGLPALAALAMALAAVVAVTDPERPLRSAGDWFGCAAVGSGAGALEAAPRRLVLVTLGTAALASYRSPRKRR